MTFDDIVDDGVDTIYKKEATNNLKSVIEIQFIMMLMMAMMMMLVIVLIMMTDEDENDDDDIYARGGCWQLDFSSFPCFNLH